MIHWWVSNRTRMRFPSKKRSTCFHHFHCLGTLIRSRMRCTHCGGVRRITHSITLRTSSRNNHSLKASSRLFIWNSNSMEHQRDTFSSFRKSISSTSNYSSNNRNSFLCRLLEEINRIEGYWLELEQNMTVITWDNHKCNRIKCNSSYIYSKKRMSSYCYPTRCSMWTSHCKPCWRIGRI